MTSDRAKIVRGQTRRDVGELFLASSGRMSRAPFLAVIATLAGLFWLYDLHVGGWMRAATGWLVDLLLVFSAACALSKRLHDRGRAGWWAGLALLAFHLAWPRPAGVAGWAAAAVLVIFVTDLAILPGQKGDNRFGP
ncbi:MAG: DUF805 domain-containing protein [Caulobacteraceae bacterium]